MWDPATYQHYREERARPFLDLLGRVSASSPRHVVDLGCGPGDMTATLLERFPTASVVGVDSSPEMIEAAAVHAVQGRLSFEQGDVRGWRPEQPIDVLLSNATLQWVPEHLQLLPSLVASLAPGGWLAFQVPGNFDAPSHRLLAELRQDPQWRDRVGQGADRALAVHEPEVYLDAIAGEGLRVDVWQTTYWHVLPGNDAVLDWTRGTALRPVLAALNECDQVEFVERYRELLRLAYPERTYGTVFPFRRIFVVAQQRS